MFGNYDIQESIGQGGMGIVYRAHDAALGRDVAIKVLKEDLRSHAGIVARFQREGQAFASLNHPNIVHIYSVGSVGKIPYIAMEYIEGESVSRMMKREKRIPWERALHIAEQVALALASAHEARIIHRDIKPGNIMLDRDDKAYVTDFGIAKVLDAETQLTIDGTRLGTPQYMSPERCQNKEITASIDIYALGIVMFQMISGRIPYEANTPISLVRKIIVEPPSRLREFVPEAPEDVERLIAFMIEKEPRNRPANAHVLAETIARVREGKPLFDSNSGMGSALESMRDTNTPAPWSQFDVDDANLAFPLRVARRWTRLPAWGRTLAAALLSVSIGAGAGTILMERFNRGFAVDVVREMDSSTAGWFQSPDVAVFVDESAGVVQARIQLNGFAVRSFGWGGTFAAIQATDGVWSAIIALDPDARFGRLAAPPARKGSPSLLPNTWIENSGAGILMTSGGEHAEILDWDISGDTSSVLRFNAGGALDPRFAGPVAFASEPPFLVAAVSPSGAAGSWSLVRRNTETRTYAELEPAGPPVTALVIAPDASWAACLRERSPGERVLTRVSTAPDSGVAPIELAEGGIEFTAGGISPNGLYMTFSISSASGTENIRIIDGATGAIRADLGEGTSPLWHPNGAAIVAVAPDRKGESQLWTISAAEPFDRSQLTFVNGGLLGGCALSRNGRWVMAPANSPEDAYIVFVDLEHATG